MYICEECGHVFEMPYEVLELHNELPGSPAEMFYECPVCGGEFCEAVRCECGGWTADRASGLCEGCKTEVLNLFLECTALQRNFLEEWLLERS